MEKQIAYAFPTLIGRFKLPKPEDLNRELRKLVLEREGTESNQQYANVGGWHSRGDFLDGPNPPIKSLRESVIEATNHMIAATKEQMKATGLVRPFNGSLHIYGWANVSRAGHYHSLHNHPGSCWSGVYYIDTGGDVPVDHPHSGAIDLLDPRPFTEMTVVPGDPYGQKFAVRPEPGMMILFPGFLYHFVHPFFGSGERISIAFNVRADRK